MTTVSHCNDNKEHSPVCFEGPEKRLELDFYPHSTNANGLRDIPRAAWDEILDLAKCTIISVKSNEFFDSYVLSESSLFVYPTKIMIKTCGTTTLLQAVNLILRRSKTLGMNLEMVMYSRKNLLYPEEQHFPHGDFQQEVKYLNKIFENGSAFVLGSLTEEHWLLYLAHFADPETNRSQRSNEQTLEIMMHGLDRNVAARFTKANPEDAACPGAADITQFIPDSVIDEFSFDPCGYSMNGLYGEYLYTIHITPEDHCSFASFETNLPIQAFPALAAHVINYFKPKSATVAVVTEKHDENAKVEHVNELAIPHYDIAHRTSSSLEKNLEVTLFNYRPSQLRPGFNLAK